MDEGRPYFACQNALLTFGSDDVGQTVTVLASAKLRHGHFKSKMCHGVTALAWIMKPREFARNGGQKMALGAREAEGMVVGIV